MTVRLATSKTRTANPDFDYYYANPDFDYYYANPDFDYYYYYYANVP